MDTRSSSESVEEEKCDAMRHRRNTHPNYNDYDYYYELSFIIRELGDGEKKSQNQEMLLVTTAAASDGDNLIN